MTYIGNTPARNAFRSPGLWTPNQVVNQKARNLWAPGADPHFANVSLLFQPSAYDATYTTDETGKALTYAGGAALTASGAFPGGGGVSLNGSGQYITLPGGADFAFGTGDFSLEMLLRIGGSGLMTLLDFRAVDGAFPTLYVNASNQIVYFANSADRIVSSAITRNVDLSIAAARSGTTTTLYVDGVSQGIWTDTTNYSVGASRPIIGANGINTANANLNGTVYSARITKGVARAITYPTTPFPWR